MPLEFRRRFHIRQGGHMEQTPCFGA